MAPGLQSPRAGMTKQQLRGVHRTWGLSERWRVAQRQTGLSRRRFLQGTGAAIASPLVFGLAERANAQDAPKRFIFVYTPDCTLRTEWEPGGTDSAPILRSILEPLAPFGSRIVTMEGMKNAAADGSGHTEGTPTLLTGYYFNSGPFKNGVGWPKGESFDHYLGKKISPAGGVPCAVLGVNTEYDHDIIYRRISYVAENQYADPIVDPVDSMRALLGTSPTAEPAPDSSDDTIRAAILGAVSEDLQAVQNRYGQRAKDYVDRHLEGISALQQKLAQQAPPISCESSLGNWGTLATGGRVNEVEHQVVGRAQVDVLVQALACDVTRSASLQWANASKGVRFSTLGDDRHHTISHDRPQDIKVVDRFYAEQFAYLLSKMDAVVEANGKTMLDNSIVLWGRELGGSASDHGYKDMTFVLAGTANGAIQGGRHLRFDEQPNNNLYLSVARALGVSTDSIGSPGLTTGPLPGLL